MHVFSTFLRRASSRARRLIGFLVAPPVLVSSGRPPGAAVPCDDRADNNPRPRPTYSRRVVSLGDAVRGGGFRASLPQGRRGSRNSGTGQSWQDPSRSRVTRRSGTKRISAPGASASEYDRARAGRRHGTPAPCSLTRLATVKLGKAKHSSSQPVQVPPGSTFANLGRSSRTSATRAPRRVLRPTRRTPWHSWPTLERVERQIQPSGKRPASFKRGVAPVGHVLRGRRKSGSSAERSASGRAELAVPLGSIQRGDIRPAERGRGPPAALLHHGRVRLRPERRQGSSPGPETILIPRPVLLAEHREPERRRKRPERGVVHSSSNCLAVGFFQDFKGEQKT